MKYLDKSLLLAFMAVLGQNQVLAADGTPPSLTNSAIQQSKVGVAIKGTIVDQNGEPIIGASVVEAGTTNATVTDIDGNFTLKHLQPMPYLT